MNQRILVTGASGALGRAVVSLLRVERPDVVMFTPGRGETGLTLELQDKDQIVRAIVETQPDLVLHLAATFSDDFDAAYAVNVAATRCLLEAVAMARRDVRVVLVGSAAEYGLVDPAENPIRENHCLRPVSVYGITKAWQTELAYFYASRDVDVVVARPFNLIGPNLSDHLFIGRLQRQIRELKLGERRFIEIGQSAAVRDYLPIDAAADQLLAIAERGICGHVYHVASGRPVVMKDLLMREIHAHGLDGSVLLDGGQVLNWQGYDVRAIYADITSTMALISACKRGVVQ